MDKRILLILSTAAALVVGACAPGVPSGDASAWKDEMLVQLNAHRAAAGAAPLQWCGTLDNAAVGHSADQAFHSNMSHTGSDGSKPGDRVAGAGYGGNTGWAENVAAGQASVDSVMGSWMNSSGHRNNILNGSYRDVGLGLAHSAGGTPYWTQVFGTGGNC